MKAKTVTKLGAGALAVVAVASLVGSISGTIAWFQYTTRVTANYTGVVSHTSESLEISLDGVNWKTDLDATDVRDYLLTHGRKDTTLRPVTSGIKAANGKLNGLYKNPIYQYDHMSAWGEANETVDYISLPFQIRARDVDGKALDQATLLEGKKVYLTGLSIENKSEDPKFDISNALRVHVTDGANTNLTFSKEGSSAKAFGKLDLNGDYQYDRFAGFGEGNDEVVYGAPSYGTKPAALNRGHYITYHVPGTQVWSEEQQKFIDGVSTKDVYYLWDGERWGNELDEKPAGADSVPDDGYLIHYAEYKAVSSEADLKAALAESFREGDVIQVGDNFFQLAKKTSGGGYVLDWDDLGDGGVAASYAMDDRNFLADDSNPYNIVNGSSLGKTHGNAGSVAALLEDEEFAFNTSDNNYYQYVNNAWAKVGVALPAGKVSIGSYESDAAMPKNEAGDVVHVGKLPYKWTNTSGTAWAWQVDADNLVDTLPAAKDANANETYYATGDTAVKVSDGVNWTEVGDSNLTLNVTIYLEGWQELNNVGSIALADLPTDLESGAIKNGQIFNKSGEFKTWTGGGELKDGKWFLNDSTGQWELNNASTEEGTAVAEWPTSAVYVGLTYEVEDELGEKHLLHWDGEKWANGGASVWDAAKYVGSAFSIGFRFSAEAHSDHN